MNDEAQQLETQVEAAQIEPAEGESTPLEPAQLQLGELLIAARERWNLSAADLARQMRLALRQVQALEENRFGDLPGNTFVRGFIRNYARVVQADPEPFLQAYEHSRPRQQQPEIEHSNAQIAFPNKTLPKWVWYLGALLVLALLSPLLIYLALHEDEAPSQVAKPASTVVSPVPQALQEAPLILPPPQAVLQNTSPGLASGPASGTQATIPMVPETPAAAAKPPVPEPAASGEANVALSFEGDAWVEIRDKSGKIVFSKLSRRGETQAVQGKPPFSVVVGNAAQVRIAYNGKPFDLAPYIKVNVARFKLE
jgi:cytoskeleton protein RodZ